MSQSPAVALRVQRYEDGWEAINRMIREDRSWGGHERKCFHVACDDGTFASIGGAAGVDFAEDGRALSVLDIERDGKPDLVLRNRNSPQLRILKNVWPTPGASLWIRLEGVRSNRDAIGARVTLRAGGSLRLKEVHAGSFFLSQSSRWLCFGLGKDPGELRAEVRWPGGGTEVFESLRAGRRYVLVEGTSGAGAPRGEPFRPGREPATPSAGSGTVASKTSAPGASEARAPDGLPPAAGTWLVDPLPAPDFSLPPVGKASGEREGPSRRRGKPLVVHFASITCPACAAEASEIRSAERLVAEAGGAILHVLVDIGASREECAAFRDRCGFTAPAVQADLPALAAYNIVHRHLWNRRRDLAVPCAFLLDAAGSIARAYRGGVPAADLAGDIRKLPRDVRERLSLALPFPGTLHRFSFHRDLLGLGNAYFEAGLFDLARSSFGAAVERERGDADSLFNYAVACADSGLLDEAEAAYRRILATTPGAEDARNNLGTLLARSGRAAEAAGIFHEVLARNPAHAEAALNLSNVLMGQGQFEEAIAVSAAALEKDPESGPFHRQLGVAQFRAGRPEEALASHRQALAIDPLDHEARLGQAIILMARGEPAEARKTALEGLTRQPSHAGLLNALGMAHAGLGEVNEAIGALEQSIAADPRFDRPYTNLARILLEGGRREEARAALRRCLEALPGNAIASRMLEEVGP